MSNFGKLFSSLYTGSMVGAGPVPFALMPYVIANTVPDQRWGGYVELNPILLAAMIGAPVEQIEKAIEFLCSPDPRSRSKLEEGRRLVKVDEFGYQVVNFLKYRAMRNTEDRREQVRVAQAAFRAKKKAKTKPFNPTHREAQAVRRAENGDDPDGLLE